LSKGFAEEGGGEAVVAVVGGLERGEKLGVGAFKKKRHSERGGGYGEGLD